MSFVPQEELTNNNRTNMAPMIDFLFLMVVFFATLAVSRVTTKDTEIDLVKLDGSTPNPSVEQMAEELKIINISVTEEGEYKWVTELRDYKMTDPDEIRRELHVQYTRGILPEDRSKTKIMLKIDRKAEWDPIMQLIFAVRDEGFEVRPVYEPSENAIADAAQENK